ncbi:putative ABC transport system permease protein [Larkinella arboricola]|uniref:Putative ABC transport system permease protein n=2 Tax=Larkinella arboricola TaxID=643671 RepID=A0A327X5N1_LARAB|nr:putative ABC transport system permease protein [Larkinella arboricola]
MDRELPQLKPQAASIFDSWLWKMAWRDSRRSRKRLFLFMSAIVLGIAALVAINSFGDNLSRSVDEQARELIGADLVLTTNKEISKKTEAFLAGISPERSQEVAFPSMVMFPRSGGVRLAQVKALQGKFPYYGDWETQPTQAVAQFRKANENRQRIALVDDALLVQLNARPGDSVKVGKLMFYVAGRVMKIPGQTAVSTTVAPTVFIPRVFLAETGLLERGSRVTYRSYYQFEPGTDVDKYVKNISPRLDKLGINSDTVTERKQQTGRAFADLTKFLNLVAFVALLLGCVGVASAVHLYVKEKIASVAVLRCLGASGQQAFLIYLIQTSLMGFIGALIGAALGTVLQLVLPAVFGSFLPVEVVTTVSWKAVAQGIGAGLVIAILFALLPLLVIRKIAPLRTLRSSYDDDVTGRDPLQWAVYLVIAVSIFGFAYWQIRDWKTALGFTAGLAFAFGVLTAMGQLLMVLVRRFFPVSWSYIWRQSLANLYRPQNQTLILVISIGLGAFLIATLYLTQTLLLSRVQLSASGNQANMVLFDIQNEQKAGVQQLAQQHRLPVLQTVPVVTMRLAEINGRTVDAIQKDTSANVPDWALTREYRVTYRDTLISSEKLTAGKAPYQADGNVYISVEKGYLERTKLKLGDTLTFNVQGLLIPTIVAGTRDVDWNRIQTNFLIVFPNGVLEQAPQFHVLLTRVGDTQQSARFQRDLVLRYPNVSAIDLGLILQTIDEVLEKVSFVIQFMALFSIITGLLVLSSSVIISKYQRIQESVLLRTLGANRRQILLITLIEYLFLGLIAAFSGIVLSLFASWGLAYFVFEIPFMPNFAPLLAVIGVVTGLTILIGLFNSRGVLVRPPLEVLRAEA